MLWMAHHLTQSSDRWPVYAYCDSQFSAFSTEVLNHASWKHNRSGSPLAHLAEQSGTQEASTGAGQPNYWQKTQFETDAYIAISENVFAESLKVSGVALRDLCWKHTNSLKVPWARKAKKLIQKVNVRTRSSVQCQSENWKKKLCFCRALTWHILSQDFKRVSLRLQPPIPKAEYFLLSQFSKLNSSGFEREIRLPG